MQNAADFYKNLCDKNGDTLSFVLLTKRIQICLNDREDTNDLSSNCSNRPELNFVGYRTFPAETT